MSGEGSTFQVRGVKVSNAGYYRCVVSNSMGSETSQRASLTVGRYIQCSHTCSCENNLGSRLRTVVVAILSI